MTPIRTITVDIMKRLIQLPGSISMSDSSYSTCGNSDGGCDNHWRCVQRQGQFGHKCFNDLRNQTRH